MRLLNIGIRMNVKKISRLMKKFNLRSPIRKATPYRRMAKALKTRNVAVNILNREFKEHGPRMILLTDITYMFYRSGQKAYLSTILDSYTKQVLAYVLSDSLEVEFVLINLRRIKIIRHPKLQITKTPFLDKNYFDTRKIKLHTLVAA